MSKPSEIRKQIDQLFNKLESLSKPHAEYHRTLADIEAIQRNGCNHKNAYWLGTQTNDDVDQRRYDNIYCPDCHYMWEERAYGGEHRYKKLGE